MSSRLLVALTLVVSMCTAAYCEESAYLEQKRRMADLHISEILEPWLEAQQIPGAVAVLVEGDEILYMRGFGLAETRRGVLVTPEVSIFPVGDLVRVLTATAVLQLVDRGKLDLNADVARVIPWLDLSSKPFGPLTATDLLLHAGGIDQRVVASRARAAEDLTALGPYLEKRLPPRIRPAGVTGIPSAHGYSLLGLLVEESSGETFDAFVDRSILTPLEMSRTWLDPGRLPSDRIVVGYRRRDGQLEAVTPDFPRTLAASSLWTTAADMASWMRMILSDGSREEARILEPSSVAMLLEPHAAPLDALPGRSLAFQERRDLGSYALAIRSVGGGFSSSMTLLARPRIGLMMVTNIEIDLRKPMMQILEPFDSAAPAPALESTSATDLQIHDWTGWWRDASTSLATAERLVSLVRQDTLRATSDGALLWRSRRFDPADAPCFEERDSTLRLCFVEGQDLSRFAIIGDLVLEKLPWHQSRPLQITVWVLFTAFFLAAGWPRESLPSRQESLAPEDAFPPRWPLSFARVAAALHFVFIASLVIAVALQLRAGSSTLLYEVPLYALGILSLPLLAAALTVIAAAGISVYLRSPRTSWSHRLHFLGLLAMLVLFLPFLRSWNLLGFHL